eukprot:CAMPEP_0115675216 /NCGR_PEP_ID=MMETSP0272-20121206/54037_1 /TAXON_ID=71861 /ORGANISM="Scrippsiella trochoidea, Strain CCMP3099" /LENGTH=140 /DNA_ID=CAMNT_0003114179 /DNA_START=965 /DNA_END=1386 /DNA_ORIENTATION=-
MTEASLLQEPELQSVQLWLSRSLKRPGAQTVHVLAPESLCVPAGQARQEEELAAALVPGRQMSHALEPTAISACCAPPTLTGFDATIFANLNDLQVMEPGGLKVPASHVSHDVPGMPLDRVPSGQGRQAFAPTKLQCPGG